MKTTIQYPENAIIDSPQMRLFMCECGYISYRSTNMKKCKCGRNGTFPEQTIETFV